MVTVVTIWAAYIAFVHTYFGQTRVVTPLVRASLPPLTRTTLEVVWHASTLILCGLAAVIGTQHVHPNIVAFDAAAALALALALLFLWVGPRRAGNGFAAPQWMLLGPLFICMATMRFAPGLAGPLLLALIGAVHFAWAAGVVWPSPSRHAAPAYIAGLSEGARFPSRLACITVGVVLVAGAVALAHDQQIARWLCVVIFAVRFIYGVFEIRLRPTIRGTPYAHLSLAFYSPLCLLIAGLALTHG